MCTLLGKLPDWNETEDRRKPSAKEEGGLRTEADITTRHSTGLKYEALILLEFGTTGWSPDSMVQTQFVIQFNQAWSNNQ